jgi:ABC-type lipoprotein export system ATPase subunit
MTVDNGEGSTAQYDVKELWRRNKQGCIESLRRRHIGFALQSGELLTSLNVRENIAAPLNLNGIFGRQCRDRVEELLKAFGLEAVDGRPEKEPAAEDRATALPQRGFETASKLARARVNKLSGGEYQRVVLARAVAHRPAIVFVDEPTSALNRELARTALRLLREARSERGGREATVMITHDEVLATEFADLIVRMAPLKGRTAGEVVEIVENCP